MSSYNDAWCRDCGATPGDDEPCVCKGEVVIVGERVRDCRGKIFRVRAPDGTETEMSESEVIAIQLLRQGGS